MLPSTAQYGKSRSVVGSPLRIELSLSSPLFSTVTVFCCMHNNSAPQLHLFNCFVPQTSSSCPSVHHFRHPPLSLSRSVPRLMHCRPAPAPQLDHRQTPVLYVLLRTSIDGEAAKWCCWMRVLQYRTGSTNVTHPRGSSVQFDCCMTTEPHRLGKAWNSSARG